MSFYICTLINYQNVIGLKLFVTQHYVLVVSKNWATQCVRLKVTVKSDNCGDSQDCSGNGVCYTNVSMVGI